MKTHKTYSLLATHKSTLRVVLVYAAFSFLWITFSDQILLSLVSNTKMLTTIQTIKGFLFIAVTSVIIYLLLYREIAAVIEAETRLRENQEKYRLISTLTGQIVYDRYFKDGTSVWSGLTEKIIGYHEEELNGLTLDNWKEMIHEDDRDEVMHTFHNALEQAIPYKLEYRLRSKNGAFITVEDNGNFLLDDEGRTYRMLGSMKDISERKQMEENFRHSQKMEAIGTLAGGIAHDFNNILSAIIGYADIARDEAPKGSKIHESIDHLLEASYRAKELVKQILAFSRQTETKPILFQPATIVKEAMKMLRPTLPTTIEIIQHIDASAGPIIADPTQFNQIIMNLCTNAFHAMEQTGGTLTITLKEVKLDEMQLNHAPHVSPGTFVRLSVADTGIGIPDDIREKVFSPYFTTKDMGKGTGMGLSIVHGTVLSYGGIVTLESAVNRGTIVHIDIPAKHGQTSKNGFPLETIPGGKETILLVDDEKVLTDMTSNILNRLGYRVTTSNSSTEALTLFKTAPDTFDCLITDQTMPGLTGVELSQEVLKIRPDIPIILCTGYSSAISKEEADRIGIRKFIFKPISKKDIAVIIRSVLDQ